MAPVNKPIVLVVHGSWHSPPLYAPLTSALLSAGFDVRIPHLPTCGGPSTRPPTEFGKLSLADDAIAIRSELIRLIEYEQRYIIVACRSYGGFVGSEAVTEDLCQKWRSERGLRGGVAHLVYFAAFHMPKGQSMLNHWGSMSGDHEVLVSSEANCLSSGVKAEILV